MRRKVERWWRGVDSGLSPDVAARQAGLPALLVGQCATMAADPGLPFEFLARHYQLRWTERIAALQAALVPIVALVMGLVVGTVAVGFFQPLVALIDHENATALLRP